MGKTDVCRPWIWAQKEALYYSTAEYVHCFCQLSASLINWRYAVRLEKVGLHHGVFWCSDRHMVSHRMSQLGVKFWSSKNIGAVGKKAERTLLFGGGQEEATWRPLKANIVVSKSLASKVTEDPQQAYEPVLMGEWGLGAHLHQQMGMKLRSVLLPCLWMAFGGQRGTGHPYRHRCQPWAQRLYWLHLFWSCVPTPVMALLTQV